jgi:hypothetical protein
MNANEGGRKPTAPGHCLAVVVAFANDGKMWSGDGWAGDSKGKYGNFGHEKK